MVTGMQRGNLAAHIPASLSEELVTTLCASAGQRVERIVSRGHTTAEGHWYDQAEHEFVLVVQGAARVLLEGQGEVALGPGDWLDIPARTRHRVTWTEPDRDTVWLAVFRKP